MRPSSIQGLGVFALRTFRNGEYIRTLSYEREITETSPLNSGAGERADHCTLVNGRTLLVAYPDRHMNHSCDPNAYYRYDNTGGVSAHARRTILVDEEISVDYLVNNAGGDSWPCHCGAERCRGRTGTSFFDQPLSIQREYAGLLAPWFVDRFANRLKHLRGVLRGLRKGNA